MTSSKISSFLSRTSTNDTNRKRKAAILIVRFFNKLLSTAPTPFHRVFIGFEIMLSKFSEDHIEVLITSQSAFSEGAGILADELKQWRSLSSAVLPLYAIERNHLFRLSEPENDSTSERTLDCRPSLTKHPIDITNLTRNIEIYPYKKQNEMGSGGGCSAPSRYPDIAQNSANVSSPNRRSLIFSNSVEKDHPEISKASQLTDSCYTTETTTPNGMRRAKSESAMIELERLGDMTVLKIYDDVWGDIQFLSNNIIVLHNKQGPSQSLANLIDQKIKLAETKDNLQILLQMLSRNQSKA
ncbi:hypothetical protein DICVIV_13432 [Dictyocaulus viviparus]|uniref:Uncharacterized protein n=1 Tax=Dictyocaulus viviparus TaxID=29172 RepID=A0A0D8XA16_DICVI|nr:hypothetical protein DICVIV_13432 [Dictyocaulus viviparus]